jgi:AAA lid domain-containing protein
LSWTVKFTLSPEARAAFRDYLSLAMEQPGFANARSVRNSLEAARFRHARRLVAEPERHRSRDDLLRLEPSAILPGRDYIQPLPSASICCPHDFA